MHARSSEFTIAQLRRRERRFALTVIAAFLVAGLGWVFLTDLVLYSLTRDPATVARLETAKGWSFVLVAAVFLYPVLRRSARRLTRAQATLAVVIDSIADGVLLLGPDRRIRHVNRAAVGMLRCPEDELVGMGAEDFSRRFRVSFKDGAIVPPEQLLSQRVFDEPGPLRYKAVFHPAEGHEVIVSATGAAVREESGATAEGVVSVLHDITEAERLDDVRNEFFAAAAHALKTPVTVILASAQAMGRGVAEPSGRHLSAIERQCRRIDRLVDNLLLLARIRSGTLRLRPVRLELGPLIHGVVREMARASLSQEVRVDVVTRAVVHADQEPLTTALRNLVEAALRSSQRGSIVLVQLAEQGDDAEIGVRYLARPAEEVSDFWREVDDVGVERHVTLWVVQAHGGRLVEENVGPETTTSIRLPAVRTRHAEA